MTYKELLHKLAKKEGFDFYYAYKNMAVGDCFNNDYADSADWNDTADEISIKELLK